MGGRGLMSTKGRVLVTGATGCVGRFALPQLVERGWLVSAVRSHTAPVELDGVTWTQADLLKPGDAARVVRESGATHLLHLAWYIAPGKWAAAAENLEWVRASLDLLAAFREAGGTRVVSAGSCLEYDWTYGFCTEDRTPLAARTLYGTSKHALQLRLSEMSASGAFSSAWGRIFFLYGPHEHPDRLVASVIRSILAGQPALTSHGRQVRDYLYAADVADAFVKLLESDVAGPINIGSGKPVQLREIAGTIGDMLGRRDLLQIGAIPAAPTDTPLVVADTTRLANALGWTPSWDLARGLQASIDWWRTQ
jgi:nucleoside-diphosphate-sugar epimerase